MADVIHIANSTSDNLICQITTKRNRDVSNSAFEMFLDGLVMLLENALIDSELNTLEYIEKTGKLIRRDQYHRAEVGVWYNYIGGQSMYSDVFLLNTYSGDVSIFESYNNHSWVAHPTAIMRSRPGNLFGADLQGEQHQWNNRTLSEPAKAKVADIVKRCRAE